MSKSAYQFVAGGAVLHGAVSKIAAISKVAVLLAATVSMSGCYYYAYDSDPQYSDVYYGRATRGYHDGYAGVGYGAYDGWAGYGFFAPFGYVSYLGHHYYGHSYGYVYPFYRRHAAVYYSRHRFHHRHSGRGHRDRDDHRQRPEPRQSAPYLSRHHPIREDGRVRFRDDDNRRYGAVVNRSRGQISRSARAERSPPPARAQRAPRKATQASHQRSRPAVRRAKPVRRGAVRRGNPRRQERRQ